MDIELNTISNKNAKNIIFILFSLVIVLLVIQFAVPEKTKQNISNQVFSNNEALTQNTAQIQELSGTIIEVNTDLSFVKLVTEDEISHSIKFTKDTIVTDNGVGLAVKDLRPFTKATLKVSALPEDGAFNFKAMSIDMTKNTEADSSNENVILQDMISS